MCVQPVDLRAGDVDAVELAVERLESGASLTGTNGPPIAVRGTADSSCPFRGRDRRSRRACA